MQPIEQIVLEPALVHELTQVAVGRRDDSNVHPLGPFRAERLDFAFLEDPQQLGLKAGAHRSDLVEKDRAPVGQGKLAFLRRGRVGERAFEMAEELRFQQRLRNRRAVHLDERHLPLSTAIVDGSRDQLLPRAGLAGDQHRAAGGRHQLDATDHLVDRAAVADDAVSVKVLADHRRRKRFTTTVSPEFHKASRMSYPNNRSSIAMWQCEGRASWRPQTVPTQDSYVARTGATRDAPVAGARPPAHIAAHIAAHIGGAPKLTRSRPGARSDRRVAHAAHARRGVVKKA